MLAAEHDVFSYVRDPAWLPHSYNARDDALTFALAPRDVQRKLIFLSPRYMRDLPFSAPVPVSRLDESEVKSRAGRMHFVFHTGFCCSTLLTRALDIPGVSMGLKEPAIVLEFARHWARPRHRAGVPLAFSCALDLLSRPTCPGEQQIVKPSNAANFIAPYLLHARHPNAKALLLFSSLDVHLRAIARRGAEGAEMARGFLAGFVDTIPFDGDHIPNLDPRLLTDLQAAGAAWLMNVAYLARVMSRFGPQRVRALNAASLISDPVATLNAVGDFFELSPPDGWANIAKGPTFQQHAKKPGAPFNAASYRAQNSEIETLRQAELAMAWQWTKDLAAQVAAPMELPETLFAVDAD
ncbi:MAG: hypothetical protein JSS00_11940 [Proteobacteria bacterium]|nr:hypothetical protein [Pseudomonadota bacterium]